VSALAVVQARMSSTRLPGKVLADVGGEPLLGLLLRRLGRAAEVGAVCVATSDHPDDDPVAELAAQSGARVHRGSLDDVLGRYAGAIGAHTGPVVRVTGDCPLTDPAVVDAAVQLFAQSPGTLYVQNVEPRTYPDGLDVEVVDAAALRQLAAEATDPAEREHVTLGIRRDPSRFPVAVLPGPSELAYLRWTVDTPDDLEFVRAVVERLGAARYDAGWEAVLAAARREPPLEHGLTPFPT
jgi:spore coat polysaccharide biosynthesis protein SpsF